MPERDRELVPHITRWIPMVLGIGTVIPVPAALIIAIIHAESSGWPDVSRREPGGNTSWGLMGVCTRTAAWLSDPATRKVLLVRGFTHAQIALIPTWLGADRLKDPRTNLVYGIVYLYYQYLRYRSITKAVAAYNAGHVKYRDKKYINQTYVDRVMSLYQEYKNYLKVKEKD